MTPEEVELLGDRMDALDIELFTAEQRGDTAAQISALRARAAAWREWGALQHAAGRDSHGAVLAAMRDEHRVAELLGGAE